MSQPILANPCKVVFFLGVSLLLTPPSMFGIGYYCGRTRPIKTLTEKP